MAEGSCNGSRSDEGSNLICDSYSFLGCQIMCGKCPNPSVPTLTLAHGFCCSVWTLRALNSTWLQLPNNIKILASLTLVWSCLRTQSLQNQQTSWQETVQAPTKALAVHLVGIFVHENFTIKKKSATLVYLQDFDLYFQVTGFNCKSRQYWRFSDRFTSAPIIVLVVTS